MNDSTFQTIICLNIRIKTLIFFIILISISISLSQYTLYIQHSDTYGKNIPSNIIINDIFDIIINNEKCENISLKCDLIGLYNISKIKCLLNYEGIFYITKNNLEKSFEIKYNIMKKLFIVLQKIMKIFIY